MTPELKEEPLRITFWKKHLPTVSGIAQDTSSSGAKITRLESLKHGARTSRHITSSLSYSFFWASLIFNIIDFIRIPGMYLSAWIKEEPIPVSLSRNARWAYAALVIGFAAAAFLFPTVAFTLALVGAVIGLSVSVMSLGKFFYRRKQYNDMRRMVDNDLNSMTQTQSELNKLQQGLNQANTQDQIRHIQSKIESLESKYQSSDQDKWRQTINIKAYIDKKLASLNTLKMVDRSLGIAVASVMLIGVVLSVFFPPVSAFVLAGAALFAGGYLVSRVGYELVRGGIDKFRQKSVNTEDAASQTRVDEAPYEPDNSGAGMTEVSERTYTLVPSSKKPLQGEEADTTTEAATSEENTSPHP